MEEQIQVAAVPSEKKAFKQKYPRKLSRRILMLCFLLIAVLCAGITKYSYQMYEDDMYVQYQEYERAILLTTLGNVDAEGLKEAIETQTENDAYDVLGVLFNNTLLTCNIESIYAVYFTEDGEMRYVLNGYLEEDIVNDPTDIHTLGELPVEGSFDDEFVELFRQCYQEDSEYVYFSENTDAYGNYWITAYCTIEDDKGNAICIVGVDIDLYCVMEQLMTYVKHVVIGVAVLGIIFLTLLYLLLHRQVVSPVMKLAQSAKKVMSQSQGKQVGELVFHKAKLHTKDEIELLNDSLSSMVDQMNVYMRDVSNYAAEKERVNTQLLIVQQLKENLFPFRFPAFQDRTDFDIYAKILYGKKKSGDFYNFFLIDPTHICFFIGTASGSGITTTMVAMITTIYMENFARLGYQPNRILSETNNQLSENNSGEITVNTFLGIVDLENGTFTYSQVGETAPVVKRAGKDAEVLVCSPGYSLGSLEHVVYSQNTTVLKQGECIFLYTHGVSERRDKKGYEFTDEYVLQNWNSLIQTEYRMDLLIEGMVQRIEEYALGTEQESDETMLMFRYLGG